MDSLGERLRRTPLFSELSVLQCSVLATFVQTVSVGAGDVIMREGQRGEDLYVIESGHATVEPSEVLGAPSILGPGEYFGEIALLTGRRRSADIVALTPMILFKITRRAYESYLRNVAPEVDGAVSATSAHRMPSPVRADDEVPPTDV